MDFRRGAWRTRDRHFVRLFGPGPPITIHGTTISGTTIPGTTTQTTVPGTVSGQIQQMTYLMSGYVDLLPGARIVPFVGAGIGIAFISDGVGSCGICSTQFAYQGTVGVGYNVNDNIRIDFETRYYGTTSPGTYNNNNITTRVRARYKFNQRRDDQQRRQDDRGQDQQMGPSTWPPQQQMGPSTRPPPLPLVRG